MADEQRCETCRFWRSIEDDSSQDRIGDCRRFPPSPDGELNFPLTLWDTWCGEWEGEQKAQRAIANPVELVANLDVDAIRERLQEIAAEDSALRTLLRSALARRRKED